MYEGGPTFLNEMTAARLSMGGCCMAAILAKKHRPRVQRCRVACKEDAQLAAQAHGKCFKLPLSVPAAPARHVGNLLFSSTTLLFIYSKIHNDFTVGGFQPTYMVL